MKTLVLTKQTNGHYSNKVNNIEVVASICSNGWEGTITDDNNEDFIIFKTFANTKKEVVSMMTNYILSNM